MAGTDAVKRNCWEFSRLEQKISSEKRSQGEEPGLAPDSSQKNGPGMRGHICSRRFICSRLGPKFHLPHQLTPRRMAEIKGGNTG